MQKRYIKTNFTCKDQITLLVHYCFFIHKIGLTNQILTECNAVDTTSSNVNNVMALNGSLTNSIQH